MKASERGRESEGAQFWSRTALIVNDLELNSKSEPHHFTFNSASWSERSIFPPDGLLLLKIFFFCHKSTKFTFQSKNDPVLSCRFMQSFPQTTRGSSGCWCPNVRQSILFCVQQGASSKNSVYAKEPQSTLGPTWINEPAVEMCAVLQGLQTFLSRVFGFFGSALWQVSSVGSGQFFLHKLSLPKFFKNLLHCSLWRLKAVLFVWVRSFQMLLPPHWTQFNTN